jgi:hypothetical protein
MVCQPLRLALLIGAITAVAVSPAQANQGAPACGNPCGASAPTAPCYRTITCTEWVKETYQVKRTSYKVECRTETFDTFRCESVPEVRERTVCVVKKVPVETFQVRKVAHKVTTYEEKIVNKTEYKYVQETVFKKQLVRLGHWETREVQPLFGNFFGGHGHAHGCGDACGSCTTTCAAPCPKTRKVWVHCPEYRECPVTVCKKVCVTVPVSCKVPVCSTVWHEERVKVCTYQCVNETRVEKCTVYVNRQVPCKATRTVRVCVPCEEMVTCCKMVPRTVTRQVAETTSCSAPCSDACSTHSSWFSRFGARRTHRCSSDCNRSSCCN